MKIWRGFARLFQLATRPKYSSKMLWQIASNPTSFRIMWIALKRWGASQDPLELCQMIRFVRSHDEHKVMMEIGSRRGGTLYAWCQIAAYDAKLISIDFHPEADDEEMKKRYQSFTMPLQNLTCLRVDSHLESTRESVILALNGEQLSFLFIDGDHSYEGVKQDFDFYSPFVIEGGLIAFHDIIDNPNHPNYGVPRFWRELRDEHRHYEFVGHRYPGFGVGILEKK